MGPGRGCAAGYARSHVRPRRTDEYDDDDDDKDININKINETSFVLRTSPVVIKM